MSLLKRFFGSSEKPGDQSVSRQEGNDPLPIAKQVTSALSPMPITLDMLKQLFPIRNFSDEEVTVFALNRNTETFGTGSVLFVRGEPCEAIHYLIEGKVLMDLGDNATYEVHAHTAKSRFPLCSSKHYSATAKALTDIQILRVSPKIMSRNMSRDAEGASPVVATLDPQDPAIPEAVRASRLFQAFCLSYREDELKIPTLPDVAIKLRAALEQHIDIDEVVKIVQLDPAIAAKLVHVANSPLYLPTRTINSCKDAVLRLGLLATRNLVISYSLRQIFHCRDEFLKKLLHAEWKKSIYISSLCYVLAQENSGIREDEALLAGLLSDIGVTPFLHFAENFPREYWSEQDIEVALPWVRGPVGAYVLNRWEFPEEMVNIPLLAEDWFHDSGAELSLSDIVALSRLHSYIGTPQMSEMPAINSIPAHGKLKNQTLSPAYSLLVLHEAKDKINQALKLFET